MPEVRIIDTNPRPIAVVRVTTVLSKWPSECLQVLDKVYAAVMSGNVRQIGQNVMVYYHREDGKVDIECGVETGPKFEPCGELFYSETPSGLAVTTTHLGPYAQLGTSHDTVAQWSRRNGLRCTGICWEVYGDWEEDESKLQTDIFHLVQC